MRSVFVETTTVWPTEIVILSPALGTASHDHIAGLLQSPLPIETQVAAIDDPEKTKSVASNNMSVFIDLLF